MQTNTENTNQLTVKELRKLTTDHLKLVTKKFIKSIFITALILVVFLIFLIIAALGLAELELPQTVNAIIAWGVLALSIVVVILANIPIYKDLKKRGKELVEIIKNNPVVLNEYNEKARQNFIIRLIVTIIFLVIYSVFMSAAFPSNNVSYGKGGYEMPNESDDSVADYIERVDPDLYNEINDRYEKIANGQTVY